MGLFGSKGSSSSKADARIARHSSGWAQLGKVFAAGESLRVLDFGPTSAGNINFLTALGHSIYMSSLVEEAARPEWRLPDPAGEKNPPPQYDAARFLEANLDFSGRQFDAILLFDTLDYLPAPLVPPVVERLTEVLTPGGHLLAFFHSKPTGDETIFSRYHLTAGDLLEVQRAGRYPVVQTYSNRQVETLFAPFAGSKFFLAKDALREVLLTR